MSIGTSLGTLLVVAAIAAPAAAGEWHARLAASRTDVALGHRQSEEDGSVLTLRGRHSTGVALGIERTVSKRIGVELAVESTRPGTRITVVLPDGEAISARARLDLWTVRAGLNLHLLPDGPLDLHVGPAVAWLYTPGSLTFRARVGARTSTVTLDTGNAFGWGGTAGADLDLGGGWTMGASYTRLEADMDFSDRGEHPGKRSLALDPAVLRLGVGLRF